MQPKHIIDGVLNFRTPTLRHEPGQPVRQVVLLQDPFHQVLVKYRPARLILSRVRLQMSRQVLRYRRCPAPRLPRNRHHFGASLLLLPVLPRTIAQLRVDETPTSIEPNPRIHLSVPFNRPEPVSAR